MKERILFCCLFFLLAASLAFASAGQRSIGVVINEGQGRTRQVKLYQGSYALLVGVSDYRHGWPDLESVPTEIGELKKLFQDQGFKVETVLNPDGRRLENAFADFIDRYGYDRENRLLFFFAGHGYTRRHGAKGYLVPADAPNPQDDEKGFLRRALTMTDILAWSRKIEAKHALFLFDSCFSGAVFKQRALPKRPPYITSLTTESVRQFISAGSAGETVPARSTFVPVLIDALSHSLADLNHDGYVSGTELGLYLQTEIPKHVHQSPQYGKISDYELSRGDFIFVAGGSAFYSTPAVLGGAASPKTGSLTIKTRPPGAAITISGRSRGRAPLTLKDLAPGRLPVKAVLSEYETAEKTVLIRAGRQSYLTLLLDKIITTGSLKINSTPAGAEWYLDGAYVGLTPDRLVDIEPGTHQVVVKKSGYRDWRRRAEIQPGREVTLTAGLKKMPAAPPKPVANQPLAGSSFTDPTSKIKFVWIPQGCFEMGQSPGAKARIIASEGQEDYDKYYDDELPRHRVCIDGFWLAEKEVTVGLWRRFVNATGYKTDAERDAGGRKGSYAYKSGDNWKWRAGYYWDNTGFSQTADHPVTCVSFNDVMKFIAWLNRQGGRKYRLPTEAEWEYACRGGTTTSRFWGDDPDKACAYANVADQTRNEDNRGWNKEHECRDGYYYTAPVGSFKPNPFGLYDMLGNVWEWCADRYGSDYYRNSPVNNPRGPSAGAHRVVRGGSWDGRPADVRAANRSGDSAAYRNDSLGFRLALSSGQE